MKEYPKKERLIGDYETDIRSLNFNNAIDQFTEALSELVSVEELESILIGLGIAYMGKKEPVTKVAQAIRNYVLEGTGKE